MKKLFFLGLLFLLSYALVFAQNSSYNLGNDTSSGWNRELSIGYQFCLTKEDELTLIRTPSIVISWRHYLLPLTDTMDFGYTVMSSVGFSRAMEFKDPLDGNIYTIRNANYYMWDISLGFGGTMRGNITKDFSFVVDAGISTFINMASFAHPYVVDDPSGRMRFMDIFTINVGPVMNAGVQYRLPLANSELISGTGVHFGYYFTRFDINEIYWADKDDKYGDPELIFRNDWRPQNVNVMRFGLPYLTVGLNF
jgi:hypothetical protein